MMFLKKNIFSELSRNMPRENYFTNCFAFLLGQNRRLLLFVLRKILCNRARHLISYSTLRKSEYSIESQAFSSQGVVDIKISFPGVVDVFVENKLAAPVSARQLRRYLDSMAVVILITERSLVEGIPTDMLENERFFHTTWNQMKDQIEFYLHNLERDRNKRFFLSEFVRFMGEMGMKSFSGFAKEEYGPYWQKFAEFRESAKVVLDEVKEIMEKQGFESRSIDESDEFGYRFLSRRFRWKFRYRIQFDVVEDMAYVTVFVEFQKTFREFVRDEYYNETEEVVEKLGEDFEVEWDKDWVYRTIRVRELVKGTRSKDVQKKKILTFIMQTLRKFEDVKLIELLRKAAIEYK